MRVPFGYMPTTSTLRSQISCRHLTLVRGYVLVAFKKLEARALKQAQALKVAQLLAVVRRVELTFDTGHYTYDAGINMNTVC